MPSRSAVRGMLADILIAAIRKVAFSISIARRSWPTAPRGHIATHLAPVCSDDAIDCGSP